MKVLRRIPPAFLISSILCIAFLSSAPAEKANEVAKLTKLSYLKWYKPVEYKVSPAVKGYTLPLQAKDVANCKDELAFVNIPPNSQLLLENGFEVTPFYKSDSLSDYYSKLTDKNLTVLVTTDSVLHMFHVLFDRALSVIEEDNFLDHVIKISESVIEGLRDQPEGARIEIGKAYLLAKRYMQITLSLAKGENKFDDEVVKKELANIEGAVGIATSPLFGYEEDYSQFIPRGHYTRSDKLKKYFKAMMWLGRFTFRLKGGDAKAQTIAATLLAHNLVQKGGSKLYDTIYSTTSFFVGYADDLTPYEYLTAFHKAVGENADPTVLADDEKYNALRAELLKCMPPSILGGAEFITPEDLKALQGKPSPELIEKYLQATMGMRFMGQRFVLDSFVLSKCVWPTIGQFEGAGTPVTGVPNRTMPTALDVMYALGNKYAESVLFEDQTASYKGYVEQIADLKRQIAALKPDDWHRNLYMGWLDILRESFADTQQGYQPFQNSLAWNYKKLNTALGSWTALRHDTVLYVKQSMTLGAGLPDRSKPYGFVEPAPEVYSRLLALLRTMVTGLKELGIRYDADYSLLPSQLAMLDKFLQDSLEISIEQLQNKVNTELQKEFFADVANTMDGILGHDEREYTSTIVVDVHTDMTSNRVLQCGTGPMYSAAVAFAMPDGKVSIAIGPVYSFYEFTQPLQNRLTDEAWKKLLEKKPPTHPRWITYFMMYAAPLADEMF